MDPISRVVNTLRPQAYFSAGIEAKADWHVAFPMHDGIKFNAVLKGEAWLKVKGVEKDIFLQEGDCFLFTKGNPFHLASDLTLSSIDASSIFTGPPNMVGICNGGGEFKLIGGRFIFSDTSTSFLCGAFAPVVALKAKTPQAEVIRWALNQIVNEISDQQNGSALVAQNLAHIMLVQVLRTHLSKDFLPNSGLLLGLVDPSIGAALTAIHNDISKRWSVAELAEFSGMSRSSFAEKFRSLVGKTPIDYLSQWRIIVASELLSQDKQKISEIAFDVGYDSESSFSTAFKRIVGKSPREYQRKRNASPARVT